MQAAQTVVSFQASIKKILDTEKNMLNTHSVYITELSKNGISLLIEYLTQKIAIDEFNVLKEKINISIKEKCRRIRNSNG
jgi:small-conductance mechanosensitive channel